MIPTSNIEIEHNDEEWTSKFSSDDWGSLEFTPSLMGAYILTQKKDEKQEQPTIMSMQNLDNLSQASASTTLDNATESIITHDE